MKLLTLALCALAVSTLAAGQDKPRLKVYISADMEGVGGVSTWEKQASASGLDYGQYRRLMTLEVNAAIEGAFAAGATEVLVSDSHGDGQNIDAELLDPRVKLVRAWPRPLGMAAGIDATFDAVVLIGYHGAEGQADSILSHTEDDTKYADMKLNGVSVPEAGIVAATAGAFGVPVVFISGDQTICRVTSDLLGDIETAVVKVADGFYAGTMMHPQEARELIRAGVERAVRGRDEIKPYLTKRPVKVELTMRKTVEAEVASYLRGVERPTGNVIIYTADDMIDAAKFIQAVYYLKVD
ncbi:MAG: M55 family metallopeptidase [Proteobacteria bacterium]|nr:M55 family metallopeptidase [Pseudomonadota bacterium]MDA0992750.1 M55 family metallopeptidase [Pseudomonadota bacterium]